MNKTLKEQMEKAAKEHTKPHYENDESTWGAISESSFIAGCTWMADKYAPFVEIFGDIIKYANPTMEMVVKAQKALEALQDIGEGKDE